MGIFLGKTPVVFLLLPIFALEIYRLEGKEKKKHQNKEILQKLSEFSTLLDQGYSPLFAYEELKRFPFPEFMLHPEEENFRNEIFQKQFQLYEKNMLLEEEIQSEMGVIRLRMGIMKLMPLALLLLIRRFLGEETSIWLNLTVVFLFFLSHRLAEFMMERL